MGFSDNPICRKCEHFVRVHIRLGSFFLDPEDIRVLGVGAIWNFVKGTGNSGERTPVLRPRCIGPGEGPYPNCYSILFYCTPGWHSLSSGHRLDYPVFAVLHAWMTESFQCHRLDYLQPSQRRPHYAAYVSDTSVPGGDASLLFRALCLSKYVGIYYFRTLSGQTVWTVGTLTHLLVDMSVHVAAATWCTNICAHWHPAISTACDK
jgi:hypothetical protein